MDIRKISDSYFVSPQISPDDVAEIARAGFKTLICNRPDGEIPPEFHCAEVEREAKAAGLTFKSHPFASQAITLEIVEQQAKLLAESEAPVLAYCATGTRCSVVWSFAQAGELSADEIIQATKNAGYQLEGLRPQIEALARGKT